MRRAALLLAAVALAGCAAVRPVVATPEPLPARAAALRGDAAPVAAAVTTTAAAGDQAAPHHSLTLDGAKAAIAGAVGSARAKHTTGVVAVVDAGGNLMALERIDETFAAGAMISIGKARTAVLFKKPTRFFEELIKAGRTPMIALNDFTPLQGGIPITIGGEIVGGIGVSGAASAAQDEELAIAGANAVGQAMVAEASPPSGKDEVVFIPREKVASAFAKGMPLIEEPAANLKVHASRREGPGKAEVHTRDADVIYVLDGTATLLTGGTVIAPTSVEPEEIRGSSLQDGVPHRLVRGDVLVVPKGVPHWFQEVAAPFTYYVVKVRS
jgi:glc operon protein GlcG